jgi:STE24 endopeptidase
MDLLQRLERFLDRPLFPWKKLFWGFSLGHYLFESFLTFRQYRVLCRPAPPAVLAKEVTPETFTKSQSYGRSKALFSIVDGLWDQIQNWAILHFDVMPKIWSLTGEWLLRYAPARFTGEISHSVLFMLTFLLFQQVLNLPTSLYYTFVLEEKHGFNKQTPGLFFSDIIKTNLITTVVLPPVLAAFLSIIRRTGDSFFVWLWGFAAAFQIFMTAAYPTFILPLFNKLSPLPEGELKDKVDKLAASLKFPLHELFVIDGSKRSGHSNAYFFGLPWKKHIVLYDTLIESNTPDEVTAVLGHELGHWKLGHTTRLMAITQAHLLYVFTLFSVFINNGSLYSSFNFAERPIIIGFILFNNILAPLDLVVKLGMNMITRKYEFQADKFAKDLGYAQDLSRSLLKLHTQNLSSLDADPIYASYHFSHPHLTERLKAIGWKGDEKVQGGALEKDAQRDGEDGVVKASGRDEL